MKNTLMFLLSSLLLASSLTACGGGNYGAAGQTDGVTGDTGAYSGAYGGGNGTAGYNGSGAYGNGTAANGNGTTGYNGSSANGNGTAGYGGSAANGSARGTVPYSSLVDDTRNVLNDAENAVNRTMNGY